MSDLLNINRALNTNRDPVSAGANSIRTIFEALFWGQKIRTEDKVYQYRWDLTGAQVERALELNSVFIYQFNLRKNIMPHSISPFYNLTFI